MINKIIASVIFLLGFTLAGEAQHYVGVKGAMGFMNISSNPNLKGEAISTFNPGLVYRYEHKKYAAIQIEANLVQKGFKISDSTSFTKTEISSFELPVLVQGFYRFGAFRPYITSGFFVGRINKIKLETEKEKSDYKFDEYDRRFEYGIIIGGGAALRIARFELQAECRYQYAFSFLRDPHINGRTQYLNPTQLMVSVNLLYCLGKK